MPDKDYGDLPAIIDDNEEDEDENAVPPAVKMEAFVPEGYHKDEATVHALAASKEEEDEEARWIWEPEMEDVLRLNGWGRNTRRSYRRLRSFHHRRSYRLQWIVRMAPRPS
jgi:hypothetical protein